MLRARLALVSLGLAATMFACTSWPGSVPDPERRLSFAADLASRAGFERIESSLRDPTPLPVAAWRRWGMRNQPVHVYIEGDGLAWRSRRRISDDPTPIHPTGLMLAAADSSKRTVIYLGRPCQFGIRSDSRCEPRIWTAARFGESVVDAINRRIDALLSEFEDRPRVILLGYSGGGVVAALVAARRDDVDLLVTIAAPLDVTGWTRLARVSPLSESYSPMDELDALRRVRQHHFAGRDDAIVPLAVTEAFHLAIVPDGASRFTIVENMDHHSWPDVWESIARSNGLFGDHRFAPAGTNATILTEQ